VNGHSDYRACFARKFEPKKFRKGRTDLVGFKSCTSKACQNSNNNVNRATFHSMTMIMSMLMMVMMIWQVRVRRINPLNSFWILNWFQIRQVDCYSFAITPKAQVSSENLKFKSFSFFSTPTNYTTLHLLPSKRSSKLTASKHTPTSPHSTH
jgi:hypothetical protein